MRAVDLIARKRDGGTLSRDEIGFFVRGVTDGTWPDYQAAALLNSESAAILASAEGLESDPWVGRRLRRLRDRRRRARYEGHSAGGARPGR